MYFECVYVADYLQKAWAAAEHAMEVTGMVGGHQPWLLQ